MWFHRALLIMVLPIYLRFYQFIHVELVRDLESDCDVTIFVTCRISSNTNDTKSIVLLILPYSRLRNSKIRK